MARAVRMTGYEIATIGEPNDWRSYVGGFRPDSTRAGRRVVDVHAGTVVRVGQNVWRTWRAIPESTGELQWLCIRAGGTELPEFPHDATRDLERAMPW